MNVSYAKMENNSGQCKVKIKVLCGDYYIIVGLNTGALSLSRAAYFLILVTVGSLFE